MSDIGKGDWVQCVDASPWANPFADHGLVEGNTYYIEGLLPARDVNCSRCDDPHEYLRIGKNGLCPGRFRPLKGDHSSESICEKEPELAQA